ncbi:SDR family NAD(P)-dependent oxidoreductase [Actinomadura roseirufa]|uniref:SDR family NAD(P)-dependent oxidoreductase n=1 Tax=Actinomadura roseirufa TaxID=2094049 RepID=UPI00104164F4|nr:SDR family oxidoreductase [Actinomadura roseirufa]
MELRLSGRTAVVTGASRGIGLATTRTLIEEGVRVVGAARTVTAELKDSGAIAVSADLSTPDGAQRFIERALSELEGIDLLVNNVGGGDSYAAGGFLSVDDATWKRAFDVNFYSAVWASKAALPSLVERKGAIINVSSVVAHAPSAGTMDYAVPKAALTAWSKALAEEFGPQGVRVNTISPGPVRTAFWDVMAGAYGSDPAELLSQLPAMAGMLTGKVIEPEEVATLIAFLASDHARSIVGADQLIDAGAIKTL